jgi:hypothetical protein
MLPDELYSRRLTWDDAQHLAGEPVELIADEAKPVATLMTVASVRNPVGGRSVPVRHRLPRATGHRSGATNV